MTDAQANEIGKKAAIKMTPVHRRNQHGDTYRGLAAAVYECYTMVQQAMAESIRQNRPNILMLESPHRVPDFPMDFVTASQQSKPQVFSILHSGTISRTSRRTRVR